LAVAEGFEPSDGGYPSHAFEACSLGRSDTPPCGSLPGAGHVAEIAAHTPHQVERAELSRPNRRVAATRGRPPNRVAKR
jgi:hypothetical protein